MPSRYPVKGGRLRTSNYGLTFLFDAAGMDGDRKVRVSRAVYALHRDEVGFTPDGRVRRHASLVDHARLSPGRPGRRTRAAGLDRRADRSIVVRGAAVATRRSVPRRPRVRR